MWIWIETQLYLIFANFVAIKCQVQVSISGHRQLLVPAFKISGKSTIIDYSVCVLGLLHGLEPSKANHLPDLADPDNECNVMEPIVRRDMGDDKKKKKKALVSKELIMYVKNSFDGSQWEFFKFASLISKGAFV